MVDYCSGVLISVWRPIPGRTNEFELAGLGTTRSAADFVLALADSAIDAIDHDGTTLQPIQIEDGRALWKITHRTVLRGGAGERYLVEPAAKADGDDRLDIIESYLPNITTYDPTLTICHAPLNVRVSTNDVSRTARIGELHFRAGQMQAAWDRTDSYPATGRVSVAWRDQEGFTLDRRRLLVLPQHAMLDACFHHDGTVHIRWSGWSDWTIMLDGDHVLGEQGSCQLPSREEAFLSVAVSNSAGRKTLLRVAIRLDRPRLVDLGGQLVPYRTEVDLSRLRSLVLECPGSTELTFELKTSNHIVASRRVEGTLPFQTFHELVTLLLGLASERGPSVHVSIMNGQHLCTIRRPQRQLDVARRAVFGERSASAYGHATIAIARSLLSPDVEHRLDVDGDHWQVPDRIKGPALFYLREGETVITRPTFATVGQVDGAGLTALQIGTLLATESDRQAAIGQYYKRLSSTPTGGPHVALLRSTIRSLRGLSSRAIDGLKFLPDYPVVMARLALSATMEELPYLLRLERDLPFLWMGIAIADWQTAVQLEMKQSEDALQLVLGVEAGPAALSGLKERMFAICEQAPWFAGIVRAAGLHIDLDTSLQMLTQEHVKLRGDDMSRPPSLENALRRAQITLPTEIARLDYGHHTTLLAPIALAAVARGKLRIDIRETWAIRSALYADGQYVRLAFPHCIGAPS